jgi:hypothetical protein
MPGGAGRFRSRSCPSLRPGAQAAERKHQRPENQQHASPVGIHVNSERLLGSFLRLPGECHALRARCPLNLHKRRASRENSRLQSSERT